MVCIFFGHGNVSGAIKAPLENAILYLIEIKGVKKFYVGNNGNFDFWAQTVLKNITKTRQDVHYRIVLSHIDEQALCQEQHATIFPEGLEKALPKYAISKRNHWLIKNSAWVIAYKTNQISNCHKWVEKAKKAGLEIINLAERE